METQLVEKSSNTFTGKWWEEFVQNTNNFTEHHLVKDGLNGSNIEAIKELTESIIKKVVSDKKRHTGLRIWKDGDYKKEHSKIFKKNPIQANEGIQEWKERVLPDEKFGLFLNHANTHSEELSQHLLNYLAPFYEKFGIPVNGISTTIILGDYGWTPLGIHRDFLGEYIVHLHLGPGRKDMYIWEKKKSDKYGYKYKVMTENIDDFMNDYSYKISIDKGDIFGMTGKKVHIGNTHEFSISLVIEFNGLTKKEFIEKMWFSVGKELFNQNFTGDKAIILPSRTEYQSEKEYFEFILRRLKHYNVDVGQTIKSVMNSVYKEFTHSLFSKQGFSSSPYLNINSKRKKKEFKKKLKNTSFIQLTLPYRILYYKKGDHLVMFIRGVKLKTLYHQNVVDFLDTLNRGDKLKLNNVEKTILKDWNPKAITKMLYVLWVNRGIEFV